MQEALASAAWTPWRPLGRFRVGACYACFAQAEPGRGRADDIGWAAAALGEDTAVTSAVSPEAKRLLAALDFPTLADVGVRPEHVDELVRRSLADDFVRWNPHSWTEADFRTVYADGLSLQAR